MTSMLATELDDELHFYSDAYVTRSVHDSTPSLSGELLRGMDAVIRDVDVQDDNEDEQRKMKSRTAGCDEIRKTTG